jgi:hypothetical protein
MDAAVSTVVVRAKAVYRVKRPYASLQRWLGAAAIPRVDACHVVLLDGVEGSTAQPLSRGRDGRTDRLPTVMEPVGM